uniref:Uncharacterized protein n=1 Tax=viral metagenome TaxID=1070528 RepID=A0A6C0IE99_9ZZZZ
MSENKSNNFNTEPLLKEIENVINNGIHKILNEYVDKYTLMEQTHKQIVQLATGVSIESQNNFDIVNSISKNTENNKNITSHQVELNDKLQVKMDTLEKFIYPLLDNILTKLTTLTNEINSIKLLPPTTSSEISNPIPVPSPITHICICDKQILKNASVSSSEKENIQLEIIEESNEEEEYTGEDLESEEEEEHEEEVQQVKEVKDEKEVIVIDDDESEEEEELAEEVKKVIVIKEEKVTEKVVEKVVVVKKESVEEVIVTDDDVETEEDEEEEQEEEEEFLEIDIDDITYCTNNEENGFIYELKEDGDVGNKVGYLKEGEPFFYADEK